MVNILKDKIYNLYVFKKHNIIVVYYCQTKKKCSLIIDIRHLIRIYRVLKCRFKNI
jgi:hypothetical protein